MKRKERCARKRGEGRKRRGGRGEGGRKCLTFFKGIILSECSCYILYLSRLYTVICVCVWGIIHPQQGEGSLPPWPLVYTLVFYILYMYLSRLYTVLPAQEQLKLCMWHSLSYSVRVSSYCNKIVVSYNVIIVCHYFYPMSGEMLHGSHDPRKLCHE